MNSIAALTLARGADFLSVFDKSQRDALARLFLNLRGGGFDVAGIFWGLWLFPLGMLVYRSGFIPRFLGVLLMLGTFAYLANSFTSLVVPQYEPDVSRWMDPWQTVEVVNGVPVHHMDSSLRGRHKSGVKVARIVLDVNDLST